MRKIGIALLSLFLISATESYAASDRFAFDGSKGESLTRPCSRQGPEGIKKYWKPSESEINNFEREFEKCLSHPLLLKMNRYYRQYVGIVTNSGKTIYLSAHIKDSEAPSRNLREPVKICDGQESAFGVEYLVKQKAFRNFEFNGPTSDETRRPITNTCIAKSKK